MNAEEAEREVEASRGELDRTVEALKEKMTPGQLLDEAMRTMGDTGTQIVSKFIDQAKENPMPLAVMGLGLAWLMTSNRHGGRGYDAHQAAPYGGSGSTDHALAAKTHDLAGGLADAVSGAAHTASEIAGTIGDRVSTVASGAASSAYDLGGQAKTIASSATDKAVQYGHQAQRTVAGLIEREPLIVGGAGLLAGLAIGAVLPVTEAEKRAVAPIKDKVIDTTKAIAQDRLSDVSEAAEAAYHAVKDELAEPAQEGESLADRTERTVHAAAGALKDGAPGPH